MFRLLLVDDDTLFLELAQQFIELDPEFKVERCENASKALNILREGKHDLVVSDFVIRESTGLDLLVDLRQEGNDIPFIMFTGRGRQEVAIKALNCGADFYLQKGMEFNVIFAELRNAARQLITRRRAEESSRLSKSAMDASIAPMLIMTIDHTLTYVNPSLLRMAGLSSQNEILGHKLDDVLELAEVCKANLSRSIATSGFWHGEFDTVRKDGAKVSIEAYVSAIKNARGAPTHLVASVLDIQGRRSSDEVMHIAQTKLRDAMDLAKLVHWQYDVATDMFEFDDQFYALYGTTPDAVGGTKMSPADYAKRFLPPEEAHLVAMELEKNSGSTDPEFSGHVEHSIVRADGERRNIIVRYRIERDPTGRRIKHYGSNQDITDRVRADKERERLVAELKNSANELRRYNEELQSFASVASHDLKAPIMMIAGYAELLERSCGDRLDEKGRRYLHSIIESTDRMRLLVEDILAYTRSGSDPSTFALTPMEAVLERASANLGAKIRETKAVITHDVLPTVSADGIQMDRLMQNLLDNAIKYHGSEPPVVHVSAVRNGDAWTFSVKDNGIGIPKDKIPMMFQMFQRLGAKKDVPGNGIGLAICKKIVESHGGNIWVESKEGKGSTFFFTIGEREL